MLEQHDLFVELCTYIHTYIHTNSNLREGKICLNSAAFSWPDSAACMIECYSQGFDLYSITNDVHSSYVVYPSTRLLPLSEQAYGTLFIAYIRVHGSFQICACKYHPSAYARASDRGCKLIIRCVCSV